MRLSFFTIQFSMLDSASDTESTRCSLVRSLRFVTSTSTLSSVELLVVMPAQKPYLRRRNSLVSNIYWIQCLVNENLGTHLALTLLSTFAIHAYNSSQELQDNDYLDLWSIDSQKTFKDMHTPRINIACTHFPSIVFEDSRSIIERRVPMIGIGREIAHFTCIEPCNHGVGRRESPSLNPESNCMEICSSFL
ncbi:uncharacterized protein EDB93DRAFT_273581 [Suillus bovinus]|uniref:uncharacterized protein n=1 Tax=Suillus bovinus TaxID=48563 RepID=UPI001B86F431|nr:uncharacterized protein EDB93DRAFT_273581 [Suillus bovinus]KAG2159228.1 hypothetical protein EDB93DRAFT_273581 [Suillus bovinus]